MNDTLTTPVTSNLPITLDSRRFPSLCWSAIFGGTAAAIGLHILLTSLGVGAGLATFSPMTDTEPVSKFSMGAAIVWSVCALISLWFGGMLAGRFSHSVHSGFVHGVIVWSITLIITLLLLSTGTGMVLGGALKVLGSGLGIGGKAVAEGVGNVAQEGLKRTGDQLQSFIDEATQSSPTNAAPKVATRAKREIGFAVTRLFAPGNDVSAPENRDAVVKALTDYAQMSKEDATRTVDEWTASYQAMKAELDRLKDLADRKAREAADIAARNVSCAALWSFFALLIGLLVTAWGGSCGARSALRHTEPAVTTTV